MAAPGGPNASLSTGRSAPRSPEDEDRGEPFALQFAWLIVAGAAVVSIGLVVAQLGWDWPFDLRS